MKATKREKDNPAELRVFFTESALGELLARDTGDVRQLFDFAGIAVTTAGAALALLVNNQSEVARTVRPQFGVMYPQEGEYSRAAIVASKFSLPPVEAVEIACMARLAPDGFILVGTSEGSQRAAEGLGLGHYRPPEVFRQASLEREIAFSRTHRNLKLRADARVGVGIKTRDALRRAQLSAIQRHERTLVPPLVADD